MGIEILAVRGKNGREKQHLTSQRWLMNKVDSRVTKPELGFVGVEMVTDRVRKWIREEVTYLTKVALEQRGLMAAYLELGLWVYRWQAGI